MAYKLRRKINARVARIITKTTKVLPIINHMLSRCQVVTFPKGANIWPRGGETSRRRYRVIRTRSEPTTDLKPILWAVVNEPSKTTFKPVQPKVHLRVNSWRQRKLYIHLDNVPIIARLARRWSLLMNQKNKAKNFILKIFSTVGRSMAQILNDL